MTKSCKERWAAHKDSRCRDLRRLWRAYQEGEDCAYAKRVSQDIGEFHEYGLCFDYVPPGTFNDQREGYWRYQISWGGPSEEFRFYSSSPRHFPYRITFVFLDWFDGYERKLMGDDEKLLNEIWGWFEEVGSTENEFEKAMES